MVRRPSLLPYWKIEVRFKSQSIWLATLLFSVNRSLAAVSIILDTGGSVSELAALTVALQHMAPIVIGVVRAYFRYVLAFGTLMWLVRPLWLLIYDFS